MGTHIDVLFARDTSLSLDALKSRLNDTFTELQPDLDILTGAAPHSSNGGVWDVALVPRNGSEPERLFSEGPNGFDINLHTHAVAFGSPFRFWQLHSPESTVATSLQNVVHRVVQNLAGNLTFVAIAGGMGDSDHVIDHVYYNDGDIDSAVKLLTEHHGDPCSCWDDLNGDSSGWVFRDSRVR